MDRGFHEFGKYGSIGISWVLTTSVYLYLGFRGGAYLDEKLKSAPLFLIAGLLLGIGLSLRSLIAELLAITAELSTKRNRASQRAPDREKSNNRSSEETH